MKYQICGFANPKNSTLYYFSSFFQTVSIFAIIHLMIYWGGGYFYLLSIPVLATASWKLRELYGPHRLFLSAEADKLEISGKFCNGNINFGPPLRVSKIDAGPKGIEFSVSNFKEKKLSIRSSDFTPSDYGVLSRVLIDRGEIRAIEPNKRIAIKNHGETFVSISIGDRKHHGSLTLILTIVTVGLLVFGMKFMY